MSPQRDTILFLCVANSARSQMAEGWARSMAPAGVRIQSAGSQPAHVHPEALAVMAEVGIDLSPHRSKSVDTIDPDTVRCVVTLCAEEVCPAFPRDVVKHAWPHPDPAAAGEDTRAAFRAVRDQLGARIRTAFEDGTFG